MRKKQAFAASDYTKNMLPQNRKEVFRDVMRLHWQKLLLLGMVFLLFYSPILLVTMSYDTYTARIYSMLPTLESADQYAAIQSVIWTDIFRSALLIPLLALLSVALSGITRILRQYAWEENVHIPTDFAKGIRYNFRHTASLAALSGLIYTLCLSVYYTADAYPSGLLSTLSLLPIAISLILILPIFAISLVMIPVYTNRLFATIKNAWFVYTRHCLKSLGFLLLCLLLWVPSLLPNIYCHIFGSIGAALLTPIALLAWTLFCYDRFDESLNPLVCPELIGKGTFPNRQE